MKDLFYTIVTIWVCWKVYQAIKEWKTRSNNNHDKPLNNEGEYTDYEEIK